jgi:hypothetical protein
MTERCRSPVTPMRLEDLEKYVADQTVKINQLSKDPALFSRFVERVGVSSWPTFRDSVWGNASALAPLERQEAPKEVEAEGDGETSPEAAPSTQSIVQLPETLIKMWGFESSHFLVRSEYEEAEQAALVAIESNNDAFLVTGQSGIGPPSHSSPPPADPNHYSGKTVFLAWLLIRRLALKLPTALQINSNKAFLFYEGGTFTFQDLQSTDEYLQLQFSNPSSKIWVLVDSSNALSKPAPAFCMAHRFFVVEAASREILLKWAKKVVFIQFCMKTWSFSEILQVYVTPP